MTRRIALLAVAVVAVASQSSTYAGGKVLSPQSHPYGKSYGEWSAEHWKWTYSLPADAHPLTDTADVSAGQSGQVWFLGGSWAPTTDLNGNIIGIADRTVTIPSGKALFFSIVNAEASPVEGNGTTEAELRAAANYFADHAVGLSCTVDGVSIGNLQNFRTESPLFTFGPLPENNFLGLPEGTTSPSVADGYHVMLAPLSAGQHTIHYTGAIVFTQEADGFDFSFTLDITYRITVAGN
ncbi:MAG TPA: hypothetical protein VM680_12140 [Verrucomicrobiae bacterium]|nr:hypothetical protein [Verrucomicrobiae bacterium]